MFFSCACKLQAPWVSSPNEDDFGLQTNHRDEIQLHKFVILKHRGMQFTTWTFFNLINICIKGEGQIHPLAVWRFLFSAWETCSFPSFLSPCCLDTAASELVLISPRCDSSLALHGTRRLFQLLFSTSCQLQNKAALSGGGWSPFSASPLPLKLQHLRDSWTAFRFPYHPAFSSDGSCHEHTILLMTSICCYGNSGAITNSAQWLYCGFLQEKWARL